MCSNEHIKLFNPHDSKKPFVNRILNSIDIEFSQDRDTINIILNKEYGFTVYISESSYSFNWRVYRDHRVYSQYNDMLLLCDIPMFKFIHHSYIQIFRQSFY